MSDQNQINALNAIAGNLSRLLGQMPTTNSIEKELRDISKQLSEIKDFLRIISNNLRK